MQVLGGPSIFDGLPPDELDQVLERLGRRQFAVLRRRASAGLILAGTFCVLAVLPVYGLFEIGVAVGVGVLLDTFVVRTVLVPAGTWLLGERAWWPARP